jgi:hypothetical protein
MEDKSKPIMKMTATVPYLLLEREDLRNASVDGVAEPGLRLVGDGDDGLAAVGDGEVREQLGGVAGAEHLVDGGEPGRALVGAEVGREHALRHAPPPQKLARAARRPRTRRACSSVVGCSSSGHVEGRSMLLAVVCFLPTQTSKWSTTQRDRRGKEWCLIED